MNKYTIYLSSGETMVIEAHRWKYTDMDLSFYDENGKRLAVVQPANYCGFTIEEMVDEDLHSGAD